MTGLQASPRRAFAARRFPLENQCKIFAMTDNQPLPTVPRKGPDLSAERIAQAAMALIDEAGLDGFSFRTLAARLGCKAMSIYYYYPSKAHLFEALIDICIRETPLAPDGDWREKLRAFCLSFRQIALAHPGFFLYFAIFRMNNRAGMGFLNRLLSVFEETGLPADLRARHFRAIGYYVMGAGLDESLGYAHGPSAVDPVPEDEVRRDYPAIAAVGPYFAGSHRALTFETGLESLLDGIDRDLVTLAAANATEAQ